MEPRRPRTLLVRGGYGIYYDRIVLQIQTLERGLDGRALPDRGAGRNVLFLDPNTGRLPPFAPTTLESVHRLQSCRAGASGINIIDPELQNPPCTSSISVWKRASVAQTCASTASTTRASTS
jgi:hypothetical protein